MLFENLAINPDIQLKAANPAFVQSLWDLVQRHRNFLEKWMDWPQNLQNEPDVARYLREMHLFNQGQQHFFCFIFKQQTLAGSIALLKRDKVHHTAEIAFWKHPQLISKPEMHLICKTFIQFVWENDFLQRLEIQTLSSNIPAKKLATTLGFELEGCKRRAICRKEQYYDLEIYGLLKHK
ncbi:MAG: GNAT family N-acetyltransferase [Bacteroidota bacterium]